MPEPYGGGERGRHDVYGPTPGSPEAEIERGIILEALTRYCLDGKPGVSNRVVVAGYRDGLLSEIALADDFVADEQVNWRYARLIQRAKQLTGTDEPPSDADEEPKNLRRRA